MTVLWMILGMLAGALAAAWIVKSFEQTRNAARLRDLEARFRYAQGETLALKEQLTAVKAEAAAAEKVLAEERVSHQHALAGVAATFKRGILALTAVYFTVGIVLGGSAGWMGASWKSGVMENGEKARLEINARIAEFKAELLQKQFSKLEKTTVKLQKALHEEQIARAVAVTKFQILLESVYPRKSDAGFSIEDQKLKNSIREKISIDSPYSELAALPSAARTASI